MSAKGFERILDNPTKDDNPNSLNISMIIDCMIYSFSVSLFKVCNTASRSEYLLASLESGTVFTDSFSGIFCFLFSLIISVDADSCAEGFCDLFIVHSPMHVIVIIVRTNKPFNMFFAMCV